MVVVSTFLDTGESWIISDILQRWTSGSVSSKPLLEGRNTIGVPSASLVKTPNATAQPGYMIIARLKITGIPGAAAPLLRFKKGANYICELRVDSSLRMSIATNGTQIIPPDTVTPLVFDTYCVLEFGVLVDDTNGRVEVRKDGTQIQTLTSTALGGTANNTLDTKPGSDTTIDTIELCTGGSPGAVFDFVVTRSASVIWNPSTDWFASALVTPAAKKFTTQLIAGAAGDGVYRLQSPPTQWTVGSGTTFHSDNLRELPFTGDTSYLVDSSSLHNSQDSDSLKLQQSPADVGALKLVAVVGQIRTTVTLGSQSKQLMYDPNRAPNTFYDAIYADSTTNYVHRLWMLDTHPDGTPWTKFIYDGPVGQPREIGLNMVSPP